jgi:hypothetical protein
MKNFLYITLLGLLLVLVAGLPAAAQEKPPRPVQVYPIQNLSFGAFFQGMSGGSVIVFPDGSRSTTGDLIPASMGYLHCPAIFEVDAEPGTIINILNGPDAVLTGSSGGSMILEIGDSEPQSPMIATSLRTQIRIGGTLRVGSSMANPPGSYSGSFMITLIQE